MIFDHIFNHVKSYMSESQHGFIKHRSTVTNLVTYTDFIAKCIDNKIQVDSVYTDFSKAFDSVNHRLPIF